MDQSTATWSLPAEPLYLQADEAHVWRIALDANPETTLQQLMDLAAEERARAERIASPSDRHRFIVAHNALRVILSRYLQVPPATIAFGYNRFGKPTIQYPPQVGPDSLSFSLSHSHQVALVAVCLGHAIGVDVERVRPELACARIAEHFFTTQEAAVLRALPPATQVEAFFDCWTRKEAFLKALGTGLTGRLNSFAVTLTPGQPAALLSVDGSLPEEGRWHLEALSPWPGYKGALAVACRPCRVATFHYLTGPTSGLRRIPYNPESSITSTPTGQS